MTEHSRSLPIQFFVQRAANPHVTSTSGGKEEIPAAINFSTEASAQFRAVYHAVWAALSNYAEHADLGSRWLALRTQWRFQPEPDPVAYASLARAGAAAIRSVAPKTTIVVPGDVWQFRRNDSGPPWLAAVLPFSRSPSGCGPPP